ncbi:MAG TPA: helix-turn-helix domain-containing protein [Candidatus Binataceae bacterium]|jgi:excisionase family DNA binding protein|nr:helix-turn-helix domain-containing protein [Candidatus Binataceae bacterium]
MDRVEVVKTRVLTVQEVSRYLRVHPSTIYRMLKKNQLPAFRVGSDWRFTVEAIDKWRAEAEAGALGHSDGQMESEQQGQQASK